MNEHPPQLSDDNQGTFEKSVLRRDSPPVLWGLSEGGLRLISLFLTVDRLLSEKGDMNGALDTFLYYMKKELGVLKGSICLFHSDSGKLFLERSAGFSRQEEEKLHQTIFQLEEKSRPKRLGSEENSLTLIRSWGRHGAHLSSFVDPTSELTLVYVPMLRDNKVLGAFTSLACFSDPKELKDHETHLSFLASLFTSAARLYMYENIDKLAMEKKVRTLTSEIYELKERYSHTSLVSCSAAMQEVYFLLRKVASRKTIVLLQGEPGVEKETVAQSLHYDGLKAVGPFIKVKTDYFPEEQITEELFGRAAPAPQNPESQNTTPVGSDKEEGLNKPQEEGPLEEDKKGLLDAADGGSIFIDNIEKLPLSTQAKLLDFLKDNTFTRVFGEEPISVDVRLITGTNADLKDLVARGLFLEDLYYQINVFPITIPPLKEREEDIVRLARHFLARFSKETGKNLTAISPIAMEMLRSYDWPGNVLELEEVIHRAVLMAEEKALSIEPYDLPSNIKQASSKKTRESLSLEERMADVEHEIIAEALKRERGNISRASKSLGITRRSMGLRMKRLAINYKDFRI
ncbi:MAG: sigma-54 dependent transcriptional regulator [Deltaproteobacteria bacterium]|nr:sigma-54 dependent transcriptional regulator [Deltaproteobacteria bacterium]